MSHWRRGPGWVTSCPVPLLRHLQIIIRTRLRGELNGCLAESQRPIQGSCSSSFLSPHPPPPPARCGRPSPRTHHQLFLRLKQPSLSLPPSPELCRHGRGLITRKRWSPAIGHPGEVQRGECSEVGSALCSVSQRPRGAIHLAEVPPSPQFDPEAPSLGQKNGAERADFSGSQLRGLRALAVIKISNEAHGQVPLTNQACA